MKTQATLVIRQTLDVKSDEIKELVIKAAAQIRALMVTTRLDMNHKLVQFDQISLKLDKDIDKKMQEIQRSMPTRQASNVPAAATIDGIMSWINSDRKCARGLSSRSSAPAFWRKNLDYSFDTEEDEDTCEEDED